jgi:hypothetical protein
LEDTPPVQSTDEALKQLKEQLDYEMQDYLQDAPSTELEEISASRVDSESHGQGNNLDENSGQKSRKNSSRQPTRKNCGCNRKVRLLITKLPKIPKKDRPDEWGFPILKEAVKIGLNYLCWNHLRNIAKTTIGLKNSGDGNNRQSWKIVLNVLFTTIPRWAISEGKSSTGLSRINKSTESVSSWAQPDMKGEKIIKFQLIPQLSGQGSPLLRHGRNSRKMERSTSQDYLIFFSMMRKSANILMRNLRCIGTTGICVEQLVPILDGSEICGIH